MQQVPVIVMGVSGVGKTTLGIALADRLERPFIDADDLHSRLSRLKMERGIPLDDADRDPWLRRVGERIQQSCAEGTAPVVACSALKASYRETLRSYAPSLACLFLTADLDTVATRLARRTHAYMPASLLDSQFADLEPPIGEPRVLELDVRESIASLTLESAGWLHRLENHHSQLEETQ